MQFPFNESPLTIITRTLYLFLLYYKVVGRGLLEGEAFLNVLGLHIFLVPFACPGYSPRRVWSRLGAL